MSPSFSVARPLRAIIDGAALRHNHAVAQRQVGPARCWAVVKANAYGHGLQRAVDALAAVADGFALIELESAIALREQGLPQPLLLLEGFYAADDIPLFIRYRLSPVIHRPAQVEALLAALQTSPWPADLPVYLKIDSGMHRLGFDAAGLALAHRQLSGRMPTVPLAPPIPLALMTHFADADGPRGIGWQLDRFAAMTVGLAGAHSLGNSAAILRYPGQVGCQADRWVRPGIMLYGGSPFADTSASALDLQPVMTLESELIAVQPLAAGESVGYGCTFTAERAMRIGVLACGYADGYPRHAPSGTPVLVAGLRTRTLGRVSMDKLCVDLTDLPEKVGVGDTAILWGKGLPADEVAAAAGTISYELFCALAQRVPVQMING